MKKGIIRISMYLLATTLIVTGCKKEDELKPTAETPTTTTTIDPTAATDSSAISSYELPSSVDLVLNAKRNAAKQTFSINSNTRNKIIGTKGTKITFNANAFKTTSGASVTGTVNVELIEILKFNDMVNLNVSTVGSDNGTPTLLVSGGQIKLTATQNGNTLTITPGQANVEVPTETSDNNMQLFYGNEDANQNVAWTAPDTTTVLPVQTNTVTTTDSSTTTTGSTNYTTPNFHYTFPLNSLEWMNCDYFYRYGYNERTNIDIELPTECDGSNSSVWVVFPSINSVMRANHTYDLKSNIYLQQNLAVGMDAKIIVLTKIDGQYQYGTKSINVQKDAKETITLTSTTLAQFEIDINAL